MSLYIYSAVCKYLESGTIFFSFWLDLKLNNEYAVKLETVTFNLRVIATIAGDPCRHYIPFYTYSLQFWEPKVIGQLVSELFLISQVYTIAF